MGHGVESTTRARHRPRHLRQGGRDLPRCRRGPYPPVRHAHARSSSTHAHGGEVVPMTPEQVGAMVDATPDRYRALVILLAGAGLPPPKVSPDSRPRRLPRRTIRIDRQLVTPGTFAVPSSAEDAIERAHDPGPARCCRRPRGQRARRPARPRGFDLRQRQGRPVRRNNRPRVATSGEGRGRDRLLVARPSPPTRLRR